MVDVLAVINAIRLTFKDRYDTKDTTGIAFVLKNGQLEFWASHNGASKDIIEPARRKAMHQALSSFGYSPQIKGVKNTGGLPCWFVSVPEATKLDNHAERHIYREIDRQRQDGFTIQLLAIGSTIRMCETCQRVTETEGYQYAVSVPTETGAYLTVPSHWRETGPITPPTP